MSAKTIRVEVTAEDIEHGTVSAFTCPVAKALSRTLDSECSATSDYWRDWGRTDIGTEPERHPLPRAATRFIAAFDAGDPVEPFAFRVVR